MEYGRVSHWLSPLLVVAAGLTLTPLVVAAWFGEELSGWVSRLHGWAWAALFCVPYVLVAEWGGGFRWGWFGFYLALPFLVAKVMASARRADPEQRGNWRDFLVLAGLGLAVDLRWLEPAWPAHLAVFNKMLLLDLGIYGVLGIRQLEGVGFNLRLRLRDLAMGMREFGWYAPLAIGLGLVLGFLHWHAVWPGVPRIGLAFVFTFFFIAVPEELFFRGWVQNLLERRMGRTPALLVTAGLFGLAHFNKRAIHFNWRYVALAALAGIAYGRAWRQDRRVGASALTHAGVDTVWSQWLR